VADRARWLLLTHEGRSILLGCYVAAAVASIVAYAIVRSPGYAIGQTVVFAVWGTLMVTLVRRGGNAARSAGDQAAVDHE
jgi:hypothetical protein